MHSYSVEGRHSYDVAVIGNGALGTSLALVLARRGLAVALVGEPARPWAASTAAGAMLGCFGEVTTAVLSTEEGRAKLDLDVRATAEWPAWLAELAEDTGDDRDLRAADGTVVMLNAVGMPEIDTGNYEAIRVALTEYGARFDDIDPADIDWLRPQPIARPLRAMYLPDEHAVDAGALLPLLTTAFTRAGGTLVPALAQEILTGAGRADGVRLADGERLSAPVVVLAAGVRCTDLLHGLPEIADRIPPMVSGYGVSVLVDTLDGTGPRSVLRTPNRAFACGLHAVPRPDGTFYLGATNIISPQPRTTAALSDVQFLLDCATSQLHTDLSEGGLRRIQVGNRPVPADGYPLLGEAGIAGLWMMTGTYRDGLHQSPLLAADLARQIAGEPSTLDLKRFTPLRAPLQSMTRAEIVDGTVTHMMATGHEHAWRVPAEWPPRMERHLRRWYTQQVELLDPEFTPPPELVAAMQPEIEAALRTYYAASRDAA
jgi:glycine oxidase